MLTTARSVVRLETPSQSLQTCEASNASWKKSTSSYVSGDGRGFFGSPSSSRPRRLVVLPAREVPAEAQDAAALAVTDEPTLTEVSWPRTFRSDMRVDWSPRSPRLDKRPTTRAGGME